MPQKASFYAFSALCTLPLVTPLSAQTQRAEPADRDDDIVVYGRALKEVGIAQSGSQGTVGYADFDDVPISRTGELVENVPGVIATQHSGSGKANQYFLRGFNLDHGTDFAGFVDGAPINMRSHGHGQGYLDFNFLIPETLERIDYRKGPYFADVGDFSAAGTVSFRTKDNIGPFAKLEAGAFGFRRGVAGGSTEIGNLDLLVAGEAQSYDGPWVLAEDLERFSGLVKLSGGSIGDNHFSLQFNAYDSQWRSTDQIPERAVASGAIDRFGFVDGDLGGNTTRLGAVANANFGNSRITAFATYYDFRLVSNFTYFLEDPVNGDEFVQQDERWTLGGSLSHTINIGPASLEFGGDLRHDAISGVGLFNSVGGKPINTIRFDRIKETGVAAHATAEVKLADNLRAFLGLRYDHLLYDVNADLAVNSGNGDAGIFGPKAGLAWKAAEGLELYANYGQSFHSNDVRGATIAIDPVTGLAADRVPVFARAEGAEVGARIERGSFDASIVGFWLTLDSELVFVGDGGATEANDGSRRYGVEASMFWRPTSWLMIDAAYAHTRARYVGPAAGQRAIPGAVPEVLSAGLTVKPLETVTLTTQLRHFGSAPLIEDDSVRSDATTLFNVGTYVDVGRLTIGAELFNLFDAKDEDVTYFYESQLAGEAASVEDRHFHPVEPRQLRISARYRF